MDPGEAFRFPPVHCCILEPVQCLMVALEREDAWSDYIDKIQIGRNNYRPRRMIHRVPAYTNADGFNQAQCATTIGLPSLKVAFFGVQAPPGAPLRSGSIISRTSSPGLSVLFDQPSQVKLLGLFPSSLQITGRASAPFTSRNMNAWGLLNRYSCTIPTTA